MPRRGMGVEIKYPEMKKALKDVMPRRGMGVEIVNLSISYSYYPVMPRRGMGVEILNTMSPFVNITSCPAGAWE